MNKVLITGINGFLGRHLLNTLLSTDKFNSIHLDIDINSAEYNRNLNIYIKRFNIIRIENGHINLIHV